MTDTQTRIHERLQHNNLGLLGTQGHLLGIDFGGYGLRVALIDLHSHEYINTCADVQGTEPEKTVQDTIALVQNLLERASITPDRLVRIGVGFGGPVDPHEGRIRLSPRMPGWENFSLKDHFEQAFDTTTLVDNNANLIALAEATFGIGQGCQHLFYMHLSTGVGCGIVLDGRLYHGATATAGEIGHALVRPVSSNQPLPLEALVSARGLIQRAQERGLSIASLNDIFDTHVVGQEIVRETIDVLAIHLAHATTLLDPQIIVLGGIVARTGGDSFVQAVAEQLHHYIEPQFDRPIQVVSSVLGSDSIAIGGLAMALLSLAD